MGILKIGVVGCGRIGKLHINNLINSVPGVQVVAAADPMLDKSGAREWLAERKITNVSTDFMDVINNPEVDVVFVCSSTDTHCDVSMAAVQAGKHVFCEKPIDYDIDKIKKLLALVEEKGVKFQVGFNRRFDHNHKAVADAVKDGTIGDIILDRLLAEYVLASLNCCHGYIAVRVSGGANEYYVYFRVVDTVHEVGGNVGDLALCQPLACAGLIQHRICCCDYLYARYRVDQVVDVQLADTAAANYADFQNAHCNSLLFSRSRLRMVSLHSADRIPQLSLG